LKKIVLFLTILLIILVNQGKYKLLVIFISKALLRKGSFFFLRVVE